MAHRTQPPSRDEIAERAIDFIESLGHPLVPWQAEMLRAMFKHDGPVEVYPQPRKQPNYAEIQKRWETHCLCTMGYSKHCPIHGNLEPPQRCPCEGIGRDEIPYDWRCSQCGTLHECSGE